MPALVLVAATGGVDEEGAAGCMAGTVRERPGPVGGRASVCTMAYMRYGEGLPW